MKLSKVFISSFIFTAAATLFSQTPDFDPLDAALLGPRPEAVYDTYVIGDGSQSYTAKRWLTPFEMGRYEVTYDLWFSVRSWAEQNGYFFKHLGQAGSRGKTGAEPILAEDKTQPVVMISWNEALIWCNALSEKNGLTPCYTYKGEVLRNSDEYIKLEEAVCNFDANGWRLPTETEWEYAARKTILGFQNGGLLSGQIDPKGYDDPSLPEEAIAWTATNADRTHTVATAGTPWEPKAPPAPNSGNPNGAGIFDMSGNVLEWCWDWMENYKDVEPGSRATGAEFGKGRVCRGGSFSIYTPFCCAGDRYSYDPSEYYDFLGFRICKSLR